LVEKTRGRGRRRWSKSSGEGGLERLVYFWQRARESGKEKRESRLGEGEGNGVGQGEMWERNG